MPLIKNYKIGDVSFRTSYEDWTQTFIRWNSPTSYQQNHGGSPSGLTTRSWWRDGWKLSDHRLRIQLGLDATTPYNFQFWKASRFKTFYLSGERTEKYWNPASWDSRYVADWSGSSRNFVSGHQGSTSLWDTADNQAKVRLLNALRQRRNQLDGGTFVGELKQTLQQLRKPYKTVQDSVSRYFDRLAKEKAILRRKHPKARIYYGRKRKEYYNEISKILSDSWLETTFGIKPALSDLKDGAIALARLMNEEEFNHSEIKGVGLKEASASAFYPNYRTILSFWITNATLTDKSVWGVKYTAGVAARFHGPGGNVTHDWAKLFGFEPENFVPTVWNLAPWSWLVDYFTNVGEILEAHYTCRDDVRWLCKSQWAHTTRLWSEFVNEDATAKYLPTQPIIRSSGSQVGHTKSEYVSGSRAAVAASGLTPNFEFRVPWGDGQSFVKPMNILAVMRGSLKGLQPFH